MRVLNHARMRRPVRVHQRIDAEMSRVRILSKVPAIGIIRFSIAHFDACMVHKFPYTATDKRGCPVDFLPVILEISRALAHGMRIFTQKIRFG